MPLTPGSRLGVYEIVSRLGAGGMGEVYRARDTRLGREVALKVLLPAFARDAERMARFEREAQVLASLNHPNIAQLYGLEEHALVLEYVPGETLKGPLLPEEALPVARQIAEALEYAHEKGIVHRDLKPANVKITPEGQIKVLDFGLAKAFAGEAGSADQATSPTLTIAATQAGVILGTAAYMAPEQARGAAVDKRADIWAYGVVLYELLMGRSLFGGETVSDTLAAVLKSEVDLSRLPARTPARMRQLLQRCLERDRKKRLRDIGEARIALEEIAAGAEAAPVEAGAPRTGGWAAWAAAAVLLVVAAGLAAVHLGEKRPEPAAKRLQVLPPEGVTFGDLDSVAVSPDGKRLAFAGTGRDRQKRLWIRSLDSLAAQPVAGSEGVWYSFWSSDSRHVAFGARGRLIRLDPAAGTLLPLCATGPVVGGTWSHEDVILFGEYQRGLFRVAASGGERQRVTAIDTSRLETDHQFPQFLPDGRRFLYTIQSGQPGTRGIYAGSLDGKEKRLVLAAASNAGYTETPDGAGYLLYLQQQILMARPFDARRLAFTGEAFPVSEQAASFASPLLGGPFSVSGNGLLAYRTGAASAGTRLAWFSREGKMLGAVGEAREYSNPALSPDGKKVTVGIQDQQTGTRDVWVMDLTRGASSRLTFDPAEDINSTWSPDGSRIAFTSALKGERDLFVKAASGTGEEQVVLATNAPKSLEDWSPDGKHLIYNCRSGTDVNLCRVLVEGEPREEPLISGPGGQDQGRISPDGKWIAYRSSETGRGEIYVQSYPPGAGKWQISTAGGSEPQWRGDGKELFFAAGMRLMAAEIRSGASGLEAGVPRPLFEPGMVTDVRRNRYVVSRDGQRFLVIMREESATTMPLAVVMEWWGGRKK